MNIDEVITLDDGKEYVLLAKAVYENNNYFLASLLENNEPTENYELLKEVNEDGQLYVDDVKDQELKNILNEQFENAFDEEEANN